MNDAQSERIGKVFHQIVSLLSSDEPLAERLTAFFVVVGQVAYEYEAIERQAREEGRQAGHAEGHADGYAEGWGGAGFFNGQQVGVAGRQEAQQEAERAITGEPTATADPGAAEPDSEPQDEEPTEPAPKVPVH